MSPVINLGLGHSTQNKLEFEVDVFEFENLRIVNILVSPYERIPSCLRRWIINNNSFVNQFKIVPFQVKVLT